MKSDTPALDYLRDQVDKLKKLLDDPQPGLATWVQLYGQRMQAIVDFWNGDGEGSKAKSKTKAIWKFPVANGSGKKGVPMPKGADILTTMMQGHTLVVWALVDVDAATESRTLEVFGTGDVIDEKRRDYIGTVNDAGEIWHVFEPLK